MRLTRKFTFALVAGVLVIQASFSVLRVQRLQAMFHLDITREERVLGRALAISAETVAGTSGVDAARSLVQQANLAESHVEIRWVELEPGVADAQPRVGRESLEPLLRGERVIAQTENAAVFTYTPVRLPDGGMAAVEIADSWDDEEEYLQRSVRNAVLSTALLVALCGLVAWGVGALFIGRPIRQLVVRARQIGEGKLEGAVHLGQRDELTELAEEMNSMAAALRRAGERVEKETQARIALLEQLKHADRLRTVGTLASGIAHELGTPLNVVEGHAQLILEDRGAGSELKENATIIRRQARRMTAIIRQLLDFARREHGGEGTADVSHVADKTVEMLSTLARKRGCRLLCKHDEGLPLAAIREDELLQVLANVTMNGIQAMPDGGDVELSVARARAAPPWTPDARRDMILIIVRDQGDGMDHDTIERAFEPFFTTKQVGEGTGLGLSVAYGIVAERGGWIEVDSAKGRGSAFSIFVPAAPPAVEGQPS